MIYADFENVLVPEDNGSKMQKKCKNMKNMLPEAMVLNQRVLIINLASPLFHTQVKMLFTILLIVWSKKANTVLTLWKNILTKNL